MKTLDFCTKCKNRQFSKEKGVICGITGEKPAEFDGTCPDYIPDENQMERNKEREKELKDKDKIEGFFAFYLYWSIPISLIITIIFNIIAISSGTTAGSVALTLFEIAVLLFYTYFSVYTVYGFIKKKPDTVFIAKYQLIIIFLTNILAIILGAVSTDSWLGSIGQIIISSVWSVAFFVYLCISDEVEDRIPKENRKLTGRNKTLFVLSIVVPLVLYVIGIFEVVCKVNGVNPFASDEKKIEAACKLVQKELPKEMDGGLMMTNIYADRNSVVYHYEIDEQQAQVYDSMDGLATLTGLCQKEFTKSSLADCSEEDDPMFSLCVKAGYGVRYEYFSTDGGKLFEFYFTETEFAEILDQGYTYSLSADDYHAVIDAYNNLLPIEYFEDGILDKVTFDEQENTVQYEIKLHGTDNGILSALTKSYLKEFTTGMIPYLTDGPIQLAKLSGKDLSYKFTCDCNNWWNTTVDVGYDEYKDL